MHSSDVFYLQRPEKIKHPIVISAPHVGTAFPPEVQQSFLPEILAFPVDADWFVHELYRQTAQELGLLMIWPKYSRYVVDLNRDPTGGSLYADGRRETGVVPMVSFAGTPLYKVGQEPDAQEISRRVEAYHAPYYKKIADLVAELKMLHGQVLFYDAHSIKRHVPTIRTEPFPDMILGTNNGQSAAEDLVQAALGVLRDSRFDVRRDEIFRGGHLTRFFGQPANGVHALQLERCWDIYLNDNPQLLNEGKASELKALLKKMLIALAEKLPTLDTPI